MVELTRTLCTSTSTASRDPGMSNDALTRVGTLQEELDEVQARIWDIHNGTSPFESSPDPLALAQKSIKLKREIDYIYLHGKPREAQARLQAIA